jgi:steroid 5-alpha reductase family enzyme
MTFLTIFGMAGLAILGLMSLLWLVSLALKNASIVDIFWGAGFVVTGWVYFFLTTNDFMLRKWLLMTLVSLWGLRLSLYIAWRNIGKEEDFRYQKWRNEAGKQWWWRSFFKVFLLQGFLMWVISTPLLSAQLRSNSNALNILDYMGVAIWAIGFFFEAAGDWQLSRFKSRLENKGKLLTRGVWRYSRHPNYFGDAAQWWGYYLISAANGVFWTIFSPLIMTLLLLRVSGVALLEKTLKDSKPGYEEYMATTNAFFPWFPRKLKADKNS